MPWQLTWQISVRTMPWQLTWQISICVFQFSDLSPAVALSSLESEKPASTTAAAAPRPATEATVVTAAGATNTNSAPTTVMLVTSNASAAPNGNSATITVRPTTNGMVSSSSGLGSAAGSTVVVLSGTSAGAATPSHSLTHAQGSLPTAVTVRAATTAVPTSKTHTILVMPVSSTQAVAADGATPAKRLKPEWNATSSAAGHPAIHGWQGLLSVLCCWQNLALVAWTALQCITPIGKEFLSWSEVVLVRWQRMEWWTERF